MTREQAIEIEVKSAREWTAFSTVPDIDVRRAAEQTIDCYVALGMLTLDEPKSAEKEFIDQMQANGIWLTELCVRQALKDANLKIVEK